MILIKTLLSYVKSKLGMFVKAHRYEQLFDLIRTNKPLVIVEIGTWKGERALQMIQEAQKVSPGKEVVYIGFDLFEQLSDEGLVKEFSKRPPTRDFVMSKLSSTGARVTLYQGNTLSTLPAHINDIGTADFVFIDGGHSIETIASDWGSVQKIMGPQTVVVFDDYWFNRTDAGAKPIVDAIDTNKFSVKILPTIDVFFNAQFGKLIIAFAQVQKK